MHQAIPYKPIKLTSSTTTSSSSSSSSSSHNPFLTSTTLHLIPPSNFGFKLDDSVSNNPNPNNNHHASAAVIKSMVMQNPVIVIGRHGCCMGHVVKRLLQSLGVNPAVHEVDDDDMAEQTVLEMLGGGSSSSSMMSDEKVQLPAVFIGGKLFGGLERVMATHISGELTPILKQAGALWL